MNLRNFREQLVIESGHYNLVQTDDGDPYADNGANAFINRGQRLLDRLYQPPATPDRHQVELSPGDYFVSFRDCRAIHEVWVSSADKGMKQLEYRSLGALRQSIGMDFSSVENGEPAVWAPAAPNIRPASAVEGDFGASTGDAFWGSESTDYAGIIIMAPPDVTCTCMVHGRFWTPALTDDDDITWWTVTHPQALINATRYEIELSRRNATGAEHWLAQVHAYIEGLTLDAIEQEAAQYPRMEG